MYLVHVDAVLMLSPLLVVACIKQILLLITPVFLVLLLLLFSF